MLKLIFFYLLRLIKNFPNAGAPLNQKISAVTSVAGAAANKQTDTIGIKELIITPITTACWVCFAAPNDAVVIAWFGDTSTDADGLQYYYCPKLEKTPFTFSSAIIRWDFLSEGATTAIWQEKVR